MVQDTYQRYLSRLLLTFSDLADSDAKIAQCLTFMKISPPPNETRWTAELVRSLMPSAYSSATSASPYATNQTTPAADAYCGAVLRYIRTKGINK